MAPPRTTARCVRAGLALAALTLATIAHAAPSDPTPAALADLGLAQLRAAGSGNAVVSPLATASALGMVHAGSTGATEREIEALFGPPGSRPGFKQRLPALLKQIGGSAPSPYVMAGRVWIDETVAPHIPAPFLQRMQTRYGADAQRLGFQDAEAARTQINAWTAQHTAGRITELLPAGSVSSGTRLTLTSAIHFRSPWAQPFDAAQTEQRAFAGAAQAVPTLVDERAVLQAQVDGRQLYALPFAGEQFMLLLVLPAAGTSVDALLQQAKGADVVRWQAALQPQRCALALPTFEIAAKATALRPVLEQLGVKTAFGPAADLRPMLGRSARGLHLGDVYQAAGIRIDERGGEAVAAAAATVQAKSLALPAPPCAVDRPFVFAVLHRASGTPLFVGRIDDPLRRP